MASLFPHFPVFLDLAGRAVILLGDDPELRALAQTCLTSGAGVAVFAPTPSQALRDLAPPVRLKVRRWRAGDFNGARLVVAGAGEVKLSRARIAAHGAGALFHALAAPDQSDVALGGVSSRGALAIGVSAQHAPGALVDAVRDRLAAALPVALTEFLAAAAAARPEVARACPDPDQQAAFWSALAEEAFTQKLASESEWNAFLAARIATL